MWRCPVTLLLAAFLVGGAAARPAEKGARHAKNEAAGREEALARLLREELRNLETSSFPRYGMRRGASGTSAVIGGEDGGGISLSENSSGNQHSNVDLGAAPENTDDNRVSNQQQHDIARSLTSEDAVPPEDFVKDPGPPSYTGSEHLAEKRALPPHVLRARSSGDSFGFRLRSRSRPVYKPLYSSSEHLAARPAIPLPQLQAYQNSKGPEPFAAGAPALLDEGKVAEVLPTVLPTSMPATRLPTMFPPRYPSTKVAFHTPTPFPFHPVSTTAAPELELVPEPVAEKPALLHAVDDLIGEDTVLKPSAQQPSANVLPSTSLPPTEAKVPFIDKTSTEAAQPTTQPPQTEAAVPQKDPGSVHTEEVPPSEAPKRQSEKPVTAASVASFPTHLYLPDALVLSNQHSKPAHSRFSPGTVPTKRTTTPRQYDEPGKTPSSTTKSPLPFPPRRRMTFQPFKKTTSTAAPSTSAVPTPSTPGLPLEPQPLPHYAAVDEFTKEEQPAVQPVLDTNSDSKTTTQNLLISTEPSVNPDKLFPEVPEDHDEDKRVGNAPVAKPLTNGAQKTKQTVAIPSDGHSEKDGASAVTEHGGKVGVDNDQEMSKEKPSKDAPPQVESLPSKPHHFGVEPAAVTTGENKGEPKTEVVPPPKKSPSKVQEDPPAVEPVPAYNSGPEDESLGLSGSSSDQQSALEILEQLHKAEIAPLEDPSAPTDTADPIAEPGSPADSEGPSSYSVDDMMVSLAMSEGENSDPVPDKADDVQQAPLHLTDIEGRVIY
ncbi:uncharacterized protein LOC144146990 [Haemaphysalis longicornis]